MLCVCIFLLLCESKEIRWHEHERSEHVCLFEIFHNAKAQKCFSYQILSPLHQFQSPCTLSSTSPSIIHFSARPRKHWRMKALAADTGSAGWHTEQASVGDFLPSWGWTATARCSLDWWEDEGTEQPVSHRSISEVTSPSWPLKRHFYFSFLSAFILGCVNISKEKCQKHPVGYKRNNLKIITFGLLNRGEENFIRGTTVLKCRSSLSWHIV